MSFPGSPKLTHASPVLVSSDTDQVDRMITLQNASETLSRWLEVQAIADEPDR